jgi:hypothetical protein
MAVVDNLKRSVRGSLIACAALSSGVLAIALFESLDGFPTGLLILPLVVLIGLPFLGCCIWSVILLARVRRHGAKFASPLVICAVTLAMLQTVPFRQLALQRDFWRHRADRERIVARVEAGELRPNVSNDASLIALGGDAPAVSAGNDIVVEPTAQGHYVLFLTRRGIRHYFSGFLHVPPAGDPAQFFEFADQPPRQVVPYGKDWYFVAN